jgi:hypothetical protein
MPLSIGKQAKPYDMSKAKQKPSLRGLFSTMAVGSKDKGLDVEEEAPEMESESMDEEEMTESEHVDMAMEEASNVRSALEGEDIESALQALDKLESHLEKCAA